MTFLRVSWKIIVGLKDLLVLLLLLLFFALLFAALSASPNPGLVRDGALLLKLDGVVSEQPAEIDPLTALTSSAAPVREIRQRDIVRSLRLAETDKRIKAVVIDMDRFMGGGQASLSAIGDSLDAVKKAGKPVYAFATAYTDDSYQLAAHCDANLDGPVGRRDLDRSRRVAALFQGLARPAGREGQCLPRRYLQECGRTLYPQRPVARVQGSVESRL